MKITKFLSGIFFLIWAMFSLIITFPVWIMLFVYDLGNPLDNKDRSIYFINKVCNFVRMDAS